VQTRGYGKVFVDVLAAAKPAVAGEMGERVVAALLSLTDTMAWPTDQQVEDALLERRIYGQLTQERVRMLLGAIDAQLQRDRLKGEKAAFDYDRLQIEHIMPRSWMQHWPIEAEDVATLELAEQRRRSAVDHIGNLTLITAPLNGFVSNGQWTTKRDGLSEHSQLILNSLVVDCESWDEDTIRSRGSDLAHVACRVWSKPTQQPMPASS
jgi:hypothetical protein